MDPFKLLKADHRNVAKLFEQLEAASGNAAKLQVFEQIKTELELHTHIEEKILYPALEKPAETHDLTLEAYEEHDAVKNLLRKLSKSKTANDEWQAQAKVLQENVEHHVEEEENELFKQANSALSREEIEDLGEQLQTEKSRQQSRQATKKSSKKSAPAKKAAKATKKSSGSKKSASASKSASRSTAAKTARRSKKSAAKKR